MSADPVPPPVPAFDPAVWYPVASADDLPLRHVFHGQIWGRELAIWRADDGNVNVWENRCLHRGVRLSLGLNEGGELKCVYHGWRYANRSAGCTYIPAHPADAPARTICNRTYPRAEAAGLVWTAIDPAGPFALPAGLTDTAFPLRPLPVAAPPALARSIAVAAGFAAVSPDAGAPLAGEAGVLLLVQPQDAGRTILRALLPAPPADPPAALRAWNDRLSRLRDRIEEAAAGMPAPAPVEVAFAPVDAELARLPAIPRGLPGTGLRVRVARKWPAAADVMALDLAPLAGVLPAFQPGAHIDIHLPNGLTRQYSLVNTPGETDRYCIGVKRAPASRGGSACLHDVVREGDVLAVSAPRNTFPLRRDATGTILVAGGIGLTPMLSMAQALAAQALPFALHVFARAPAEVAFSDRLARLGAAVIRHCGLDPAGTEARLRDLLAAPGFARQLYLCGPAPMLDAARAIAEAAGWPDAAVHFEYFGNPHPIDRSTGFEIALARSALTLQVPAGRSILEVLHAHGVAMPSSCGQGACGTCIARVIEGTPDHQDVCLTRSERAAGDRIVTCVSRARSARLVLDI